MVGLQAFLFLNPFFLSRIPSLGPLLARETLVFFTFDRVPAAWDT
jgi:hypothetical protein